MRARKAARGKPRLRMNPLTLGLPKDMAWWQALPPKGWVFEEDTTYWAHEGCVYLCLKRKEADKDVH